MSTPFQDLHAQIAFLRAKTAQINEKYPSGPAQKLPGAEVETEHGRHWEMEKLYAAHGSFHTPDLARLPATILATISNGAIPDIAPDRIAFLDTETSGLAGGTGTVAFVTGVGRITPEGLHVRQFFLRDFADEPSALHRLAEYLDTFDVLVTYNGKCFDQPLLETRYRLARRRPPFARLEHLDLLHGARRLWKLRFESCRLVELERRILGHTRTGDVPGQLIPELYFRFLRTRRPGPLEPVFEHNRLDIVSLACLIAIVPRAFQSPHEIELDSGHELIGLGRWLLASERFDDALVLLRRAIGKDIPDELLFRTLWDIALTEKKLGRPPDAFAELTGSRNPYRVPALVELAKYYEHRAKDRARALAYTQSALALEDSPALRRRQDRLLRRTASAGLLA